MGPPEPCCQQLVHLLGAKVGSKLAAVDFVQKQLPTGSRYHQPRCLIGAPNHKFEPMKLLYVKLSMGNTSSTPQFLHFHVSILPGGFMHTCQKGRFDLQRANVYMSGVTWRPMCTSIASAMCQLLRYTLPLQNGSFHTASFNTCSPRLNRHAPHVVTYPLLVFCSTWHPTNVQSCTLQIASKCCQWVANHRW